MKNTKVLSSILFLFISLLACTQKMSPKEYLKEVETNEQLNQVKVFEDMEFKLMYRPDRYYRYKSGKATIADSNGISTYAFILSVKDLKTHQEVLRRYIEDENQYGQLVTYFSFSAERDFYMIEGKDTLRPAFYHFERFNNIAPTINFDVGFKSKDSGADKVFVYDDKLLRVGRIYFTFKKEELDKIDHITVE